MNFLQRLLGNGRVSTNDEDNRLMPEEIPDALDQRQKMEARRAEKKRRILRRSIYR